MEIPFARGKHIGTIGWAIALGSGSGLAILGGLLWLLIRPDIIKYDSQGD